MSASAELLSETHHDARPREDARVARWLLVTSIAGGVLSAPMFLVHFREAVATETVKTLSVPAFMVIEMVKISIFSLVATTLGRRMATSARLDAPAFRALVRGDRAGAMRALEGAVPAALVLGLLAFVAGVLVRAPLERLSILDYVGRHTDRGPLLVHATSVFYAFSITLWFQWGALTAAARAVSRLTGLSPARAFPIGNVLAAIANGLFAMISIWGPHARDADALRYALEAMLGYGLPALLSGMAVRKRGFESAALANSVAFGLALVACAIASSLR